MDVLAPFARLAAGDAAQGARATPTTLGARRPQRLTTAHRRLCEASHTPARDVEGGQTRKCAANYTLTVQLRRRTMLHGHLHVTV